MMQELHIGDELDKHKDFPSTLTAEAKRQGGLSIQTRGLEAAAWIEANLVIPDGELQGQPLILLDWQVRFLAELLRVDEETGLLKYGYGLLGVPKKNSKSTLAAALALWLCAGSGARDPHVVVAAASEDQAGLVFRMARKMVELGQLKDYAEMRQNMTVLRLDSGEEARIQRVAAGVGTLDGLNLTATICDELHWWLLPKHEDTYEVLTQAGSSRKESMVFSISTAGEPGDNLLYRQYEHLIAVKEGQINDPRFWGCWYEAPPEYEVDDEKGWAIANPSLGVTTNAKYLREDVRPRRSEASFARFFLNRWVEGEETWEAAKEWGGLAGVPKLRKDRPTWCGLDLSLNRDSTAIAVLQYDEEEDKYHLEHRIWANPYMASDPRHSTWKSPHGEVFDYILELKDRFPVASIQEDLRQGGVRHEGIGVAYDPYSAAILAEQLIEQGVSMVVWRQSPSIMGPASQALEDVILGGQLVHDGDELLTSQFRNVRRLEAKDESSWRMIRRTGADRSRTTIDGPIAVAIALDLARVQIAAGILEPPPTPQIAWL